MNPADLIRLGKYRDVFMKEHPRFMLFLGALANRGVPEDAVITLKVKLPDGETVETNIKTTRNDAAAAEEIIRLLGGEKTQ